MRFQGRLLDALSALRAAFSPKPPPPSISYRLEFNPQWNDFLDACAQGVDSSALRDGIAQGFHQCAWREQDFVHLGPLHLAAQARRAEALAALLQADAAQIARLDSRHYSPLARAVEQSRFDSVEMLLSYGADPDAGSRSALMVAAETSNFRMLNHLIDRLNLDSWWHRSSSRVHMALVACCWGDPHPNRHRCAARLLELGASPNFKHQGTPILFWACNHGDHALVDLLLNRGASVTSRRLFDGSTVFMWAARALSLDSRVVDRVIAAGASVSGSRSDGRTALMFAAHGGMMPALEAALRAPVDLRAVDCNGSGVLEFAVLSGSEPMVRRLLDLGAPHDTLNQSVGRHPITPIWRAAQLDHALMFQWLADAGADPLLGVSQWSDPDVFDLTAFGLACHRGWLAPLIRCFTGVLQDRLSSAESDRLIELASSINSSIGTDLRHALLAFHEAKIFAQQVEPLSHAAASSSLAPRRL